MITSEYELIERARTGDPEAFCELARNYQRRVYMLALHYCRDPHDAEDLSQEVWLKAFRSIGKFRGEARFYTWLRQIMINSFLNHRRETTMTSGEERTRIRLTELDEIDEVGTLPAPYVFDLEDELHQQILVGRVMDALGELTPQQRLMFLLKHREGMTYEEISGALSCSTGSIKKSLHRAVVKLRQHLDVNVRSNDYAQFAASEKS
ncbi:MAG: RNA polymerase sigma factor [Pyrinomonadaceae bacterium]